MEKVKVRKDVFEALELWKKESISKIPGLILEKANGYVFSSEKYECFNRLSFEEILEIYKYGYELEETPEEKLLKKYKSYLVEGVVSPNALERAIGVVECLNILGIKIKGIND